MQKLSIIVQLGRIGLRLLILSSCLTLNLALYSCGKGPGKQTGKAFSTSETISDPSVPQSLAIDSGSLAGTKLEVPANSLPAGSTVSLAKAAQPTQFSSLTQGENSSGSLAIQISFNDSSGAPIDPTVPVTVTMPVANGSLSFAAVEQSLANLYSVLLARDSSQFYWSSSMFISIDKTKRQIQILVGKGGIFQLVYLAASPSGFTSAVASGIAPAPTVAGMTYAGSCTLASTSSCEGFRSASAETKTSSCDSIGGVWSENGACAASYLGICHVYAGGAAKFDHYYYPDGKLSIATAKDACFASFNSNSTSATWEPGTEATSTGSGTGTGTTTSLLDGSWQLTSQTCNNITVDQAGIAVKTVFSGATATQTTTLNLPPLGCTTVQVFDITLPSSGQMSSQGQAATCTAVGILACPSKCPAAQASPKLLTYTVNDSSLTISAESSTDCSGPYTLAYKRL